MRKNSPANLSSPKPIGSLLVAICLFACAAPLYAQDATPSITGGSTVRVGEDFSYTVSVSTIGADYAPGENITVVTEVLAPSGQAIASFGQIDVISQGLVVGNADTLGGTKTFTMPYSLASNWVGNWTIRTTVSAGTDTDATNNQATHAFGMTVPDLQIQANSLIVPANPLPGQTVSASVTVVNGGLADVDPTVEVRLDAVVTDAANTVIDTQSVLVPALAMGSSTTLTLNDLNIDKNASNGVYTITAQIDPDIPDLVEESDETNNFATTTFTIAVAPNVSVGALSGGLGTFRPGDPVHFRLPITNDGNGTLHGGSTQNIRVALSHRNDVIGANDFILRDFNVQGDGFGGQLLQGETSIIDWVQILPKNFVGTYFRLVEVDGNIFQTDTSPNVLILPTTSPDISVSSTNTALLSENPDVSADGRFTAYESVIGGTTNIYVHDKVTANVTTVASGNGHSSHPSISGDGRYVVFASEATNLVPGDTNLFSDVFWRDLVTNEIRRLSKSPAGGQATGGSFNPDISEDGQYVVFESQASNLILSDSNFASDVFLYNVWFGTITRLSQNSETTPVGGNLNSFTPAISGDGKRVVFSSFATNLVDENGDFDFSNDDTNDASDVFLNVVADVNASNIGLYRISRTYSYQEANGSTTEPAISGDGTKVAFHSKAPNVASGVGIVSFSITDPGWGYTIAPTVTVSDTTGSGVTTTATINANGELDSIDLGQPGSNYQSPTVTIVADPADTGPTVPAKVTADLSHPSGDVYRVDLDLLIPALNNASGDFSGGMARASEAPGKVGGNDFSTEPALNKDGNLIVFRSRASNLLPSTITRSDGTVFFNTVTQQAIATPTLGGSLTEIEIEDRGSGYIAGFFTIVDTSGRGTGAIASFDVDSAGRISTTTIIDGGQSYDPATTSITVTNPGSGQGFKAGEIRSSGAVLSIQMDNEGLGYPEDPDNPGSGLPHPDFKFEVGGDGRDALLDHDTIRIGSNGEVQLMQETLIKVLATTNALDGETITIFDGTNTAVLELDNNDNWTVSNTRINIGAGGVTTDDVTAIRDDLNTAISSSGLTIATNGLIVSTTGVDGLTIQTIHGSVTSSEPSLIATIPQSNLITQGSGYTEATLTIGPDGVIYGFSEVDRQDFTIPDNSSSDIYLYDFDTNRSERVSVNRFGYPVAAFSNTTMPSSRNAVISSNGRHVAFSSDADGDGGLIFGANNQSSGDGNGLRDVFLYDRKTTALPDQSDHNATLLFPMPGIPHSFALNNAVPVVVHTEIGEGSISNVELYVNNTLVDTQNAPSVTNGNHYVLSWTPTLPGDYTLQVAATDLQRGEQSEFSAIASVTVPAFNGSFAPSTSINYPQANDRFTSASSLHISATASSPDGKLVGTQIFVNGANASLQLQSLPTDGVSVTVSDGLTDSNVTKTFEFTSDVTITPNTVGVAVGTTIEATRDNLISAIKTEFPDTQMIVTDYEDHSVHFGFIDLNSTSGGAVSSSSETTILAQNFNEILKESTHNASSYPFGTTWQPGHSGVHTIVAVSRDDADNYVASTSVTVTSTRGQNAPTAVTLYPLESTYTLGDTLFLQVSPLPTDDGIIQSASFFVNGSLVSTDTDSPYYDQWTPPSPGRYEIHTMVLDDEGNYGLSPITAIDVVSASAPTIQINGPGRPLTGTVRLANQLAGRIRRSSTNTFTLEGTGTDFTSELVQGQYLKFVAGDEESAAYKISSITDANTIILEGPLDTADESLLASGGASIEVVETLRAGSWLHLSADATEEVSSIQSIQFFINGQSITTDTTWPFSTDFIPDAPGNFVMRAVATDDNGNQSIVEKIIKVLNQVGEVPDGQHNIYPAGVTSVSRGSKLLAAPVFQDSDGSISRVEFYLNGKLFRIDDKEPFYGIFSPESSAPLLNANREWEITMVGIDNDDNRVSMTTTGIVAGAVNLPDIEITQPAASSKVVDGEEVEIVIEVTGANTSQLGLHQATAGDTNGTVLLYANGQEIGAVAEIGVGSGVFSFKWPAKEIYATSDHKVDIVAIASLPDTNANGATVKPVLVAGPLTIEVRMRDPVNDPQSAVIQAYQDLLFHTPSDDEVATILADILAGTITHSDWAVTLTERDAFQDIVDAVAAHYITIGTWPSFLEVREALGTYSLIPNNGSDGSPDADGDGYSQNQENTYGTLDTDASFYPSKEFRVLNYIDELFRSDTFIGRHGALPQLQGKSDTENLEENRREFVSLMIRNKTDGAEATVQQRIQGSYRLQAFDPTSEASQQEKMQEQMMQMAMMGGGMGMGGFGGGFGGRPGNNNNNNNNNFWNNMFNNNNNNPDPNNNQPQTPQYKSGISPVAFAGYLTSEEKIENLDLVWGVPERRNDFYTAALMLALWQGKQPQIDPTELAQFSSLSSAAQIEKMVGDYRFRTRFAYIWGDATIPNEEAPSWKELSWFGFFNDKAFPWTYHNEHGWIYVNSNSDEDMWFYDTSTNTWFWTSKAIYPYMRDATRNTWVYFNRGTSPRQFYDFTEAAWEFR